MNTKTMPYLLAAGALALTLGCGKGKISGTVTNSAGKALDVATVKADPAGKSATTDSAGKYSLDEVSRGDQSVTASRTGYISQTKAVKIGGSFKGDEATLDFVLGSGYGEGHSLAGTKWAFSHSGTSSPSGKVQSGTGTLSFTTETAGSVVYDPNPATGHAGSTQSFTVTALTHPADTSVEHTDNITLVLTADCPPTITGQGTRTGPKMSGTYSHPAAPDPRGGTCEAESGTWSATLK